MNSELLAADAEIYTGFERDIPFVKLACVPDFDLRAVMECGQCFRFTPVDNSAHECEYSGVAMGRFISAAQDGDTLYLYNTDESGFNSVWRRYFGLDTDYAAIKRDILSRSDREVLREAVEVGGGIRILRQDPWEALCSFIISQNNNIPRIRKLVAAISEGYGVPINCRGLEAHGAKETEYAFPTPQALAEAGIPALAELRTGFRAKYIYDAARRVSEGLLKLEDVESAPDTAHAAELLMSVSGVGPKVAACTLLFGFSRQDAFPVDVWIKRVIAKYFPGDFNAEALGPYAGVAQQYLFYYEREISLGGK